MKENLIGADDLLTTFSQQRQVLLKHTADVLCTDATIAPPTTREREAKLSAILVTSLEELKVAEEELVERTAALADLRDELEQRVRTERQLFELAPVCLFLTDVYGGIIQANRASQTLLKRDLVDLERQPIARFVPADERRGFRDGLARIVSAEGVSDWRFLLIRPTDGPLPVSAAVHVIKTPGKANGVKLLWSLRVVHGMDESAA